MLKHNLRSVDHWGGLGEPPRWGKNDQRPIGIGVPLKFGLWIATFRRCERVAYLGR